jgi:hypothetical protein
MPGAVTVPVANAAGTGAVHEADADAVVFPAL